MHAHDRTSVCPRPIGLLLLALATPALTHPARAQQPGVRTGERVVRVEGALEGLPFSAAVRAGGMIYLSGQIGNVSGTRELPAGVEAQTRQAMENVRTVLEAAGASLYDVVKCTIFLADIDDYAAFNAVYAEYWDGPPPARSAFAARGLALGALLEIDCLARDPDAS